TWTLCGTSFSASEAFNNIPNVSFTGGASPGFLQPSIRSVSNLIGDGATSPAVGVFVDGQIVNPASGLQGITAQGNTLDLERIETVFGPQNNTFGRGTIGGAINFVTKKPTDQFEASLEGEIGSFPDGRGTVVLNAPIIEDGLLSARFVGFGDASDGYVDFAAGGSPDSININNFGGRLSLRSQPTDRLTIDATFAFERSVFDEGNFAPFDAIDDDDPVFGGTFIKKSEVDRIRSSVEIAQDFDIGLLKLKGSFFRSDADQFTDTDLLAIELVENSLFQEQQIASGEIRFESTDFDAPGGYGTWSFISGANVGFTDFNSTSITDPGAGAPFPDDGSNFALISDQEVFNLGVFGELRYRPTDRMEIAAGLRYNRDAITEAGETVSTGVTSLIVPGSPLVIDDGVFSALTPSASIKYDWTEYLSTYFSFSTGFRAGGFTTTIIGPDTFDEEFALQYEVGVRWRGLDDRLALTASAFLLNNNDAQVTGVEIIDGLSVPTIANAERSRSVGGELGISARPVPGLTLQANWGVNFASLTEFTSGPDFDGDGLPDDLSGERLPNAPRHTLSIIGDYELPIDPILDAFPFIRAEYNFRTSFSSVIDEGASEIDGFDILNLRAGLRGERFEAEVFAENVLNETYATTVIFPIFGPAPLNGAVGPTRRFGARLKLFF
ncbi:MAG: TonB-dependent receptor, partial [Pseudomonadota bacterium]